MSSLVRSPKFLIVLFVFGIWFALFSRYGLRNAVPASDGPLSDMLLQMLPQRTFEDRVLEQGGRPMWNPLNGLGNDESTTLWYHPLYPTTCLTRFLGLGLGVNVEIFAHILIALVGMFFYLRSIGLLFYSSVFGAVSFTFSGMVCAYCFAPPLLMSVVWLPMIAYATERLFKNRDIMSCALLGGFAGLHLLEGMVQYSLYFALFFAVYLPFRLIRLRPTKNEWTRLTGLLALSGLIALLIGMGKLLPWLVNLDRMRGGYGQYTFFAERLFSARTLVTVIAPGVFESIDGLKQVALRSFFGIVPIAAAFFAFVKLRKKPIVLFYAVIALFSVAFTFDWALVRMLWNANETFASLTPTRLWVLGVFSLSVLAAYGAERFGENGKTIGKSSNQIFPAMIGAGVIIILLCLIVLLRGGAEALSPKTTASLVIVSITLTVAAFAFCMRNNAARISLLIIAVTINGAGAFWLSNPAKHLKAVYAPSPISKAMTKSDGRVLRIGRPFSFLHQDRVYEARALEPLEIPDIHSLALMVDRNLDAAFENVFGPPPKGSLMDYRRTRILPVSKIGPEHESFLDRLGVRYLLVNGRLANREPIATDGPIGLYDRGEVNYPFLLIGDAGAKITRWAWRKDYNSIEVQVDAQNDISLAFSQSYRKGWHALVNGKSVPTRTETGLEIIVDVPSGNHNVVFEFRAPYVLVADRITLAGYGIATLMFFMGIAFNRPKKRNEQT